MPVFEITSPDGKTFEVTAPEGATQDQVLAYAQSQFAAPLTAAPAAAQPEATPQQQGSVPRMSGFLRGLKDPVDAAAQMLEKAMPEGFNRANRTVNNWIASNTGLLAEMPEGGTNALIAQQEKEYQAQRAAAGQSGFDGARLVGNIASPVNLAIAAKAPAAATMIGKIASGAGVGGASALLNPTDAENFWTEKAKQAALGGAFGAAVPAVIGAAGRVISPKASVNPELALLKGEGVRPTIGQTLGGWANKAEEKAQSVPIVGDAIAAARQRSAEDLNRAAFNRALAPVGEKLPANVGIGNDAVMYTRKLLGEKYDDLLPKMTVQKDQAYNQSVAGLKQMVNTGAISTGAPKQFNRFLQNEVEPLFQGQQAMTGETFKRLQSKVTEQIQRTQASTNADERLLGDAYKELGDQLNQLSVRSNPKLGDELAAINTGYANFKRVQKAASSLGAEDGVFTPAQLQSAVKAADRSKDKARFAEGVALMQDLSAPGKAMLGNKVPDSGTAGRVLLGTGALSTYLLNPMIPASLVGGAAMYSAPVQSALRTLVSSRPQAAQGAARAINKVSPVLAPAAAQLGLQAAE